MQRRTRFFLVVWFVAMLGVPGIASFATSRDTIANRPVASFPDFDVDAILDGAWFSGVDAFAEDHLSVRERAIEADAALAYEVFGDSTNPEVYIGQDGFLFLAGTYDIVCESGRTGTWPDPDKVNRRLSALREALAANDADLYFTMVPEKGWAYPELLPGAVQNRECATPVLDATRAGLAGQPGYIDLFTFFVERAQTDEQYIYQRTDTHWNNYGRTIATEQIVDAILPGTYRRADLVYQAEVAKPDGGDLAELLGYGIADSDVRIETVRDGVTKEVIESPGSQREWRSVTTGASPLIPGRTVIITDSHLNTTATQLAHWFEELHIVPWQQLQADNVALSVRDADRVVLAFSGRFSAERLASFARVTTGYLTES